MSVHHELSEFCLLRQPGNRNSLFLVLSKSWSRDRLHQPEQAFCTCQGIRTKFLVVTANSSPSAFHPSGAGRGVRAGRECSEFLNIKKMKSSSEGKRAINKYEDILMEEKERTKELLWGNASCFSLISYLTTLFLLFQGLIRERQIYVGLKSLTR